MKPTDDDRELSTKLRTWNVAPEVPNTFQHEVWQRIAARNAVRRNAFWPRLTDWIVTELAQPRYALGLIALSATLSIGIAHMQAQSTNVRFQKQLETRYATSIDPLAMNR